MAGGRKENPKDFKRYFWGDAFKWSGKERTKPTCTDEIKSTSRQDTR